MMFDSPLEYPLPSDIQKPFPLSHGQLCFWMTHFLMGETANNLSRLMLEGSVVPGLVEKAVNLVLEKNDGLRSCFGELTPMQRTIPYEPFDLDFSDLSDVSPEEQQSRVADDVREFMKPFNLVQPPLFRVKLYRLSENESLLLSAFPHIASDGTTLHIFEKEVVDFYHQLRFGKNVLANKVKGSIPLAQFVAWERDRSKSHFEEQTGFWQSALSGYERALIPVDYQATEKGRHFDRSIPFPAELLDRVQQVTKERNVTFQMCIMALVASALGRFSDRKKVVINSVLENRSTQGMESLYTPALYLMPVPVDLSDKNGDEQSWLSLVSEVKKHVTQAYDNMDIPFSIMQGLLAAKRWQKNNALWKKVILMISRILAALFKKSQLYPSFFSDYLLMATPRGKKNSSSTDQIQTAALEPEPMVNVNILQSFYKDKTQSSHRDDMIKAKPLSDPYLYLPADIPDSGWEDESVNIYIVTTGGQSYFRIVCSCLNEQGVVDLGECLLYAVNKFVK